MTVRRQNIKPRGINGQTDQFEGTVRDPQLTRDKICTAQRNLFTCLGVSNLYRQRGGTKRQEGCFQIVNVAVANDENKKAEMAPI